MNALEVHPDGTLDEAEAAAVEDALGEAEDIQLQATEEGQHQGRWLERCRS